MKTKNRYTLKHQYSVKELEKFRKFCLRHGLKFATMAEYQGALQQFFSEGK